MSGMEFLQSRGSARRACATRLVGRAGLSLLVCLVGLAGCGPKEGDGEKKPKLASLAAKDWQSRVDKVDTLAEAKDARTLALIVKALADPHPKVREAAVKALARRQDKSVIPQLARAVRDSDEGVRLAAVAALQRFTGAQAVSVVLLRLGAGSPRERQRVAKAVASATRLDVQMLTIHTSGTWSRLALTSGELTSVTLRRSAAPAFVSEAVKV